MYVYNIQNVGAYARACVFSAFQVWHRGRLVLEKLSAAKTCKGRVAWTLHVEGDSDSSNRGERMRPNDFLRVCRNNTMRLSIYLIYLSIYLSI